MENKKKLRLTKQTLEIFWQHSKKYKLAIIAMSLAMILAVLGEILRPILYKQFFDMLASGSPKTDSLISVLLEILWVSLGYWACWRVAIFVNNFFQPKVMSNLLDTCYNYLVHHSYDFFNNNFVGSLVRRVNRYSQAFENITDQLYWHFGNAFLKIIFISAVLFMRQWVLGVILLGWSAIFLAYNYFVSKYKLKYDIRRAEADTVSTGFLADTITNNINVKLFDGLNKEISDFKSLTASLYRLRKLSWDIGAITEAVQSLFMVALEITLMGTALHFWKKGQLTIGDFTMIQVFVSQLFSRLWDMGKYIRQIFEYLSDAQEMTEILLTPHEINDASDAVPIKIKDGRIKFENVDFGYKGQVKIFNKFNLDIEPGERVALIGPSGGGKTTVTKLLFRFFDIQGGKILIDGQDISKVTQESLRQNISLVPQDPILFHRTLMENIKYAKPQATDEEAMAAAKMAHCHEFISVLPQGYQTYVGERGIKLSGGERQRVAIARAILKNAPILVLDEATSSLDSESEHLIQDALKKLMVGKTTIVIAHRLSTIMQMDRILVLEKGEITEEGRHEELLKARKGTYQRLWEIQAGSFAFQN